MTLPTIQDIRAAHDAAGLHFFDRAAMRMFGDTMATLRVFRDGDAVAIRTKRGVVYHFDAETARIDYAREA